MHKRDQTATSYIPAQPPPSLRESLAARAQQMAGAPYVIISEAHPMGIRQSVVNWAMLSGPVAVIVGLAIVGFKLDGWLLAAAVVVLVAWQVPAGFLAAMFGSGQMLAWLTDRRWGRVAVQQERNRHEEEMLRLERQSADERLGQQMEAVQMQLDTLSRRLLTDGDGQTIALPSSNYLTNHPDPMRTKALTWAATLYKGGRPDPGHVRLDGRIYGMALPFSARGEWDSAESAEGRRYLMERGIILEVPGGYALNIARYPTLPALGRV